MLGYGGGGGRVTRQLTVREVVPCFRKGEGGESFNVVGSGKREV